MEIVYDGPSADGVKIAETGQVARPGEPVDVADELGERLLEQDIWRKAGAKRRPPRPLAAPAVVGASDDDDQPAVVATDPADGQEEK